MPTHRAFVPIPTTQAGPAGVNRVYTAPFPIPADVTQITVRGANRTYSDPVLSDETIEVAVYTTDGTGTGNPTGTPTGQDFLSLSGLGIIDTTAVLPATRGSDGLICLVFTLPNPIFGYSPTAIGYYAESTTVVNPLPVFTGTNPSSVWWLEIQFTTAKTRNIILTDSIGCAYNTANGWLESSWNLYALDYGEAVGIEGVVQFGNLQNFAAYTTYTYLWDEIDDIIPGSNVILQLGTNDLPFLSLPAMQTALQDLITHINTFSPKAIYGWTIPPNSIYDATLRNQFNTWFVANYQSLGLAGYYDSAASANDGGVADPLNLDALYPPFDSGDGVHPSAAGQVQIENGWAALLQNTAVDTTVAINTTANPAFIQVNDGQGNVVNVKINTTANPAFVEVPDGQGGTRVLKINTSANPAFVVVPE